jgi:hypothetical protein
MAKTHRKITFNATFRYTAYPYGKPGAVLAADTDVPVPCTAYTAVIAMNSADARAKVIERSKSRGHVVDVLGVDLELRRPIQDAALLAERDAKISR